MKPELAAIQFPHPGREHDAAAYVGGVFPWNVGEHRRKFLETTGSWVDAQGSRSSGPVRFWGEWEPPSDVVQLPVQQEGQPRFLHRPRWDVAGGRRQNTDPLVLGGFAYSNCRQHRLKDIHSPTRMQHLDIGSVVLFGSKRHGGWVLDTMFVVGDRQVYGRQDVEELAFQDPLLGYAVLQPLYSNPDRHLEFVLYRGATIDHPVDGRYSFVPAVPAGEVSFVRPRISHETMNENLAMAPRLLTSDAAGVHQLWESVRDQVLEAGLMVATSLDGPAPAASLAALPAGHAAVGDSARAC